MKDGLVLKFMTIMTAAICLLALLISTSFLSDWCLHSTAYYYPVMMLIYSP